MKSGLKSKNPKYVFLALIIAFILFLLFGIFTALIKTTYFKRMTPVIWWDWSILAITSLLIGAYVGLYFYNKERQSNKAVCSATSGGIFGFLTYGCAICNKILIAIIGFAGITTYFMPIQPYLGVLSIGLLGYGIYDLKENLKRK